MKPEPDSASESATTEVPRPPCEACEVNLDYIHAFEEQQASLPARPDILLLPSDLKPFVKVGRGSPFTLPANDATGSIGECMLLSRHFNHWLMWGLTTGMCSQGQLTQSCVCSGKSKGHSMPHTMMILYHVCSR